MNNNMKIGHLILARGYLKKNGLKGSLCCVHRKLPHASKNTYCNSSVLTGCKRYAILSSYEVVCVLK